MFAFCVVPFAVRNALLVSPRVFGDLWADLVQELIFSCGAFGVTVEGGTFAVFSCIRLGLWSTALWNLRLLLRECYWFTTAVVEIWAGACRGVSEGSVNVLVNSVLLPRCAGFLVSVVPRYC